MENCTFAAFTVKEHLLWCLSRTAKPMYPVKFILIVEHASKGSVIFRNPEYAVNQILYTAILLFR